MNEEVTVKEQKGISSVFDLVTEEVNLVGFRAPFIVWGVFFGSLFWLAVLGRKNN